MKNMGPSVHGLAKEDVVYGMEWTEAHDHGRFL